LFQQAIAVFRSAYGNLGTAGALAACELNQSDAVDDALLISH
jgi:hypothetical protein